MSKETILSINEGTFNPVKDNHRSFEGIVIITDKQIIETGIEGGQDCCESFGYLTSEDNIKSFEGASLLGLTRTDTCLNVEQYNKEFPYGLDGGDTMFINIETSKGTLQIVVYNNHNGYYGHEAFIRSEQLNEKEVL